LLKEFLGEYQEVTGEPMGDHSIPKGQPRRRPALHGGFIATCFSSSCISSLGALQASVSACCCLHDPHNYHPGYR